MRNSFTFVNCRRQRTFQGFSYQGAIRGILMRSLPYLNLLGAPSSKSPTFMLIADS